MGQRKGKYKAWQWDAPSGLYDAPDPHPEITNAAARRVLDAALKTIPMDTHRGPVIDDPDKCIPEIFDYQRWLKEKLRSSGLAKGLAAGPGFLPDIATELSWPWNVLARILAPRNYEQLTRRVAGNLEWYVDQSRPTCDPFTRARAAALPSLGLTLFLMLVLFFSTDFNSLNWVMLLGAGALLFSIVFATVLSFSRDTQKHATNAAELYFYLLEEYKEPHPSEEHKPSIGWQERVSTLKGMRESKSS